MENNNKHNLKDSILQKIEKDDVCPRSRWFFVCKETLFWIFWVLSVVVGAIAFAVTCFVLTQKQYALYEATHENFFTFIIGALPYIWFVVFGAMAYFAVNNLRCTKRAYKYHPWKLVTGSIVLSVLIGALLQVFGLGYVFDKELGEQMKMYMSQEKLERALWQAPTDGRLLGNQLLVTTTPTTTIVFEDVSGDRWNLNVSELSEMDLALLQSERLVRIIGTTTQPNIKVFRACGVFPWMLDRSMKIRELDAERQAFVERVYKHKDKAKERIAAFENEVFVGDRQRLQEVMGVCAEIAPVRRIEASMR